MGPSDALVLAGSVMALMAVFFLRLSWSKPSRSNAINTVAWSLLLSGLLLGALGHGAWGLAITLLTGMVSASLLLSHSAIRSPAGKAKAANRRVHLLPEAGEPLRIGHRLATFLMAVPGSLVASLVFALGARGIASSFGWSDADANVLALLAMPVVWSVLMIQLLIAQRRKSQLLYLAVPTGLGAILLGLGPIG